jgi:two-component system, OmpR family, sensor histidine kinase CreC
LVSIRLVIILAFVVLAAAGVLVVTGIVNDEVPRHTYAANEESLADMASLLASLVEARLENGQVPVDDLRKALEAVRSRDLGARIHELEKRSVGGRVDATDGAGVVVFDSDGGRDEGRNYSRWNDVRRTLQGEYGARASRGIADDPLTSVHYVAAPIRSGSRIVGVLSVGKPVRELGGLIEAMQDRIAWAALLGVGSAALVGVAVAFWIARPLRRLAQFSEAVAEGQRLALPKLYGREVQELGRALDGMREALMGRRQAESAVRGLVHEVKAPLAGIRASAELLLEELGEPERQRFLGHILTESGRLETLVGRMLELAALEGRPALGEMEQQNLQGLAREAAEAEASLATQKGVLVETKSVLVETRYLEAPVEVRGDALLLRQALRNLVHNAVRAASSGRTVTVAVMVTGEWATVTVDDTGPGIPDYALPRLFERFYSVPLPGETRRGTGLGLAFVREVALLHGGEATLANREDGGARATLRLPL